MLTVDFGAGPVVLTPAPVADGAGNWNYQDDPSLDLSAGDVVTADDGVSPARSLTVIDLTWDSIDYAADTATGTAPGLADGTEVFVNIGNESDGEEVMASVSGGVWTATFSIDVTETMGGQVSFPDAEGDDTFADSPQPPRLEASSSLLNDFVQGNNWDPGQRHRSSPCRVR